MTGIEVLKRIRSINPTISGDYGDREYGPSACPRGPRAWRTRLCRQTVRFRLPQAGCSSRAPAGENPTKRSLEDLIRPGLYSISFPPRGRRPGDQLPPRRGVSTVARPELREADGLTTHRVGCSPRCQVVVWLLGLRLDCHGDNPLGRRAKRLAAETGLCRRRGQLSSNTRATRRSPTRSETSG